jgi:hypothetical protein
MSEPSKELAPAPLEPEIIEPITGAAGLIIGAGGALSPVLAAILHNVSSVAVVANSSRLIWYRLE